MYNSDQKISKFDVEVQVHLDNGNHMIGTMAVSPGQRISDLLNDDREFVPLQTSSGTMVILRKSVINRVVPLDQQVEQEKITDPFEILGVDRGVSDEELKQAYYDLCGQNHPDKVHSSGLSPQFTELANSRMLRINDAYQRILAMRRAEAANGKNGSVAPDPFA